MKEAQVTIICLCFNHQRFVRAALDSVAAQTHPSIQLIVVDDASTDGSKAAIIEFLQDHPKVQFISLDTNLGNCAAFNAGLKHATGEFVIDLSADDLLLPDRVERGVREFSFRDKSYGVQFTDAEVIDEVGGHLGYHSDKVPHNRVPQGNIYAEIIRRYFVCPTSMLVRRKVFDEIGGYDETLAYEDFDFWIRSSREFRYFYVPSVLVKKRIVQGSQSDGQFRRGSKQQHSTFRVCEKILSLNRSRAEQRSLSTRVTYEFWHAVLRGDLHLTIPYLSLWVKNQLRSYKD